MQIKILKEEGYELALRGMSYSFRDRALLLEEWWAGQFEKARKRGPLLCGKGAGHDKFLRQIVLWIDIEACRAWWSEFDTYKVGTVAQSESTMHKLAKREPNYDDFEEGTVVATIETFKRVWHDAQGDINILKMNLPEGYLQRRLVTMNYENLRNIINQRHDHRLKWWRVFCDEVLAQVEHPEFSYKGVEMTDTTMCSANTETCPMTTNCKRAEWRLETPTKWAHTNDSTQDREKEQDMNWTELEMKVIRWAEDRRIIPNATPVSQLLKAVSEMGELADAEGKRDRAAIEDAVGDVLVCLINYCALRDLDMTRCLAGAYEQIKDRRGTLMPDGTFVKERQA